MARTPVVLHEAAADDADVLAAIWSGVLRRADPSQQAQDVRGVISLAAEDPAVRIVVAEYDGSIAGAVYLRLTTVSPLNLDPVVMALSPHVLPHFRRRGVGKALMEASVAWAEELGIGQVASAAVSGDRDANRFMARLALTPRAVLRVGATSAVRHKLSPAARGGTRQLTSVLAQRRSQRLRRPAVSSTARDSIA